MKHFFIILCIIIFAGAAYPISTPDQQDTGMDKIAESYLVLSFQMGSYDSSYIDAYFGPEELKKQSRNKRMSLKEIVKKAGHLVDRLKKMPPPPSGSPEVLRHRNLIRFIEALRSRAQQLDGKKMTFDEECKLYYDAVLPPYSREFYSRVHQELDRLLPGKDSLKERNLNYAKQFKVPSGKVEAIFRAVVKESRKRTKAYFKMAANESFRLHFVKGGNWVAFNSYDGNSHSDITVNINRPHTVDTIVEMACHEGYPGHHLYNAIAEERFYKQRGWVEYSLAPIYNPVSLMAEGTANFSAEVVFPGKERVRFYKEVLFPLAGLDPDKAELYVKVNKASAKLDTSLSNIIRQVLNKEITRDKALEILTEIQLTTVDKVRPVFSFAYGFRSYVINYDLGEIIVGDYIIKNGGTGDKPEKRWELFKKMMLEPVLPGDLLEKTVVSSQ